MNAGNSRYIIRRLPSDYRFELPLDWTREPWSFLPTAKVDQFHEMSVSNHPVTRCRVAYDDFRLYWSFSVVDRWVRAEETDFQAPVCRDSCVEFFFQPCGVNGYLNFEINCIGTLRASFVEDATRVASGLRKATPLSAEQANGIVIESSITQRPYVPENPELVSWQVDASVPFEMLRSYGSTVNPEGSTVEPPSRRSEPQRNTTFLQSGFDEGEVHCDSPRWGTAWRGNFYKCADDSSHPHWASWAPIGRELNFHTPQNFRPLIFR